MDEAVIDKLFRRHRDYFTEHQIGRDIFLTYRIPNIWQESGYRLMRPFMNIMSIAEFAKEFGYAHPPVFEIIHWGAEMTSDMVSPGSTTEVQSRGGSNLPPTARLLYPPAIFSV